MSAVRGNGGIDALEPLDRTRARPLREDAGCFDATLHRQMRKLFES